MERPPLEFNSDLWSLFLGKSYKKKKDGYHSSLFFCCHGEATWGRQAYLITYRKLPISEGSEVRKSRWAYRAPWALSGSPLWAAQWLAHSSCLSHSGSCLTGFLIQPRTNRPRKNSCLGGLGCTLSRRSSIRLILMGMATSQHDGGEVFSWGFLFPSSSRLCVVDKKN